MEARGSHTRGDWWSVWLLACSLGGLFCGVLEWRWLERQLLGGALTREGSLGVFYVLGLGILGGVLGGLFLVALFWLLRLQRGTLERGLRQPGLLFLALLSGALFVFLNRHTFQGAAIQTSPWRLLFMSVFFGAGGLMILLLCHRGPRVFLKRLVPGWALGRLLWGLLGLFGAGLAFFVDGGVYPGQYPDLHLQLGLFALAVSSLSFLILLWRSPSLLRGLLGLLLAGLLGACWAARRTEAVELWRSLISSSSVFLKQELPLAEAPLRWLEPLPKKAVADVKAILARSRMTPALRRRVAEILEARLPHVKQLSLLLISVDTVRADHVHFLGGARQTTPELDRLAPQSVVFERAYCQFPTSAWSFSSLLNGRQAGCAPVFWESKGHHHPFPADFSLAGLLGKRGWRTVAECAFNRETTERRDVFGHFRDGFQLFNPHPRWKYRTAPAVAEAAIQQLKALGRSRFFLWVHFLDPHAPYEPHREFPFGKRPIDRYDAEIAFADRQVGRVFKALKRFHRERDTVVVFLADHGEEFFEHQGRYHCTSLYEEQIHVPLLLRVPGLTGRRIREPVGLVDVLPTLTELLAVKDPYARSGRSLWPLILSLAPWESQVYAELSAAGQTLVGREDALVRGNWKLIARRNSGTEELYDLSQDPREKHNLVLEAPSQRLREMRGLMRAARDQVLRMRKEAAKSRSSLTETPRETLARLLKGIAEAHPKQLRKRLVAFGQEIVSPVCSVAPRYASLLRGPLREEARAALLGASRKGGPLAVLSVLRLACRLEDTAFLPLARHPGSRSLPIIGASLLLRAILGDASVAPLLLKAFRFKGAPERDQLALGLLLLGRPEGLATALAASHIWGPVELKRLVVALGRFWPKRLLDLAEERFFRSFRASAPLRLALVTGLSRMPEGPRRNRLLARLAQDTSRIVARQAGAALASIQPAARHKALLRAGAAEAEADDAIFHRDGRVALDALERAVATSPKPPPALIFKLLTLGPLLARGPRMAGLFKLGMRRLKSPSERARGGVRQRFLPHAREILTAPLPYKVVAARVPEKGLPWAWNQVRVRLRNTGSLLWPASPGGFSLFFYPVLFDAQGHLMVRKKAWRIYHDQQDLSPDQELELCLPFPNPPKPGRFSVGLVLGRTLPTGEEFCSPPVPTPAVFRVVKRLF